MREYEAAIKVLIQVIEGKPDSADAWYELAKVHHKQGNEAQREACIERVIALKPEWEKFTTSLRDSQVPAEEAKSEEEISETEIRESAEGPQYHYPYEMLDALITSVLRDLFFLCDQEIRHEPFLLPRSGYHSEDAIRILTLAAAKDRREEAYTGFIAYLKLRPGDEPTWMILMSLANDMNLKESVKAAEEALSYVKKEEIIPADIWDRFPTLEIPKREHPATQA